MKYVDLGGGIMRKTFKIAFFDTIPVLCGYLFLGMAYGLLLQKAGYGVLWAFFTSLIIYAGSMQFVLISFIGGGISLLSIIIMTLSVNCRHMFYGLSFIEKFKKLGKKSIYMIFSLTDETYSILCSLKNIPDTDEKMHMFFVAILNHSYWILGSMLGCLIGEVIPFDTTGVDFAMTALFTVIFTEQWLSFKSHIPAITGIICGVVSLIIFGSDNFILPALLSTVFVLMLFKNTITKKEGDTIDK